MKTADITLQDIALLLDDLASSISSLAKMINDRFDGLESILRKEIKELRQETI